ncbi:MAG TPA: protein-disulfide reductase DsbD domain-containing protein, partial [Chitinophagaceae bacterium]
QIINREICLRIKFMKKLLFVTLALAFLNTISAQNPVSWAFTSKKISDKVYELHLTATIQPGWHLYSQKQPEDAIAQPTSFTFNNNPLLNFDGTVKELGKMQKYTDKLLDVSAYQYSNKVNFVQVVKLKGKVKTAVTGKLEFQTCDDKKCLPPKTVPFTIALN